MHHRFKTELWTAARLGRLIREKSSLSSSIRDFFAPGYECERWEHRPIGALDSNRHRLDVDVLSLA